jgi:hypothetical protein
MGLKVVWATAARAQMHEALLFFLGKVLPGNSALNPYPPFHSAEISIEE